MKRSHDSAPQPPTIGASPGLEWSHTLCDGRRVSYAAAEAACTELGPGWRMPARMELESILDLTRYNPAADTARFPDTQATAYWSCTPCAWSPGSAWVVNFSSGLANDYLRDNSTACVRAVRSVASGQ